MGVGKMFVCALANEKQLEKLKMLKENCSFYGAAHCFSRRASLREKF